MTWSQSTTLTSIHISQVHKGEGMTLAFPVCFGSWPTFCLCIVSVCMCFCFSSLGNGPQTVLFSLSQRLVQTVQVWSKCWWKPLLHLAWDNICFFEVLCEIYILCIRRISVFSVWMNAAIKQQAGLQMELSWKTGLWWLHKSAFVVSLCDCDEPGPGQQWKWPH